MTPEQFLHLLDAELGLSYTQDHLTLRLDDLPGWDSVHLLRLMSAVPGLPLREALAAQTLDGIRSCL